MSNTYYVLKITKEHPDAGLYWCGYDDRKCHQWTTLPQMAIRFCRYEDAQKAGLSAPNTPYKNPREFKNKGIEVEMRISDEPVTGL